MDLDRHCQGLLNVCIHRYYTETCLKKPRDMLPVSTLKVYQEAVQCSQLDASATILGLGLLNLEGLLRSPALLSRHLAANMGSFNSLHAKAVLESSDRVSF
jgi:hypothetical protein